MEKKLGRKLRSDEHVDHKKPLNQGGGNGIKNLRVRDASENKADGGRKGNRKGKAAGARKGHASRRAKKNKK